MPIDTGIGEFRSGFTRFCLSGSNTRPDACRTLLIGAKAAAGTANDLEVLEVYSVEQAATYFGARAPITDAVRVALDNQLPPVYVLSYDEAGGATAAVWTMTVSGPATESGTIYLQIHGRDYSVPVTAGDDATTIAAAIAAVLAADQTLPYDVTASGADVTFTAPVPGTVGNYLSVIENPYVGQSTPAGVSMALVQTTAGAGSRALTDAEINQALGTCCYDCIGLIEFEQTTVANLVRYLDDETGTWSCQGDQCFGHLFHPYVGPDAASIATYGAAYNDQERTIIPIKEGYHLPPWMFVGAWAARTCAAGCLDPSRPVVRDNGVLVDLFDTGSCGGIWTRAEKEQLINAGVAAWDVSNQRTQTTSALWIENNITNYKTNAFGQTDETWQQVAYRYAAARLVKELRRWFEDNYSSHALVSDGTRIPPGKKAVSPMRMETELKAFLRGYDGLLIENAAALDGKVIVERDTEGKPCGWGDANRVNVAIAPDLINQLLRIAVGVNVEIEKKNCTTA